jgi:DNA repair protein SbcD/Mre11
MRILHTGDWHVGKTLARHSRIDEARQALEAAAAVAHEHAVDAVLVCGDVFEHLSPSPEAEETVYDALVAFEREGIPVVLLAGNHDHPHRWRALEPLLRRFAVHVVPEVRRPERGGIVEIAARDGSMTAQIAALPWVTERRLIGAAELMGLAEQPFQTYATEVGRLLEALGGAFDPGKCNVLAAHLYVSGATPAGSERALTIGDLYAVAPQAIPTTAQYVALGHVHRPQRVPGVGVPARYAGSLLQLDFGEAGEEKGVVLVELEPGMPARVEEIPLRAGRRLSDVRGTLEELERYSQTAWDDYLRVFLVCERPQPGLGDRVRELLPNALEVRLEYEREAVDRRRVDARRSSPRELFERYHRERHGADADDELLVLFDRVLDEVTTA